MVSIATRIIRVTRNPVASSSISSRSSSRAREIGLSRLKWRSPGSVIRLIIMRRFAFRIAARGIRIVRIHTLGYIVLRVCQVRFLVTERRTLFRGKYYVRIRR